MLEEIKRKIRKLADPEKARDLKWFFKTGPGEYGEGDIFLGLTVPVIRKLAREYIKLNFRDMVRFLRSPIHEERLLALLMLVERYRGGGEDDKKKIYKIYLRNSRFVNNWDLVDLSAQYIVGPYLRNRNREILYELAGSRNMWERRIAVISTFNFIRDNDFKCTLEIARMLIGDKEDLLHKAVGWMLREVGNRDRRFEENFLLKYYKRMPRTMLRYAIEKFPEHKRKAYLKNKI